MLRGRWVAGHIVVVVLAVAFVGLGFWQLARDRQKHDRVAKARIAYGAPAPELAFADHDPASGARVQATGFYDDTHDVVLRNQPRGGDVGVDLVTPLRLGDGSAVLVDRGWVASAHAALTLARASVNVVVRGTAHESRPLSAQDAVERVDGHLSLARVDVATVRREVPYVLRGIWIEAQFQSPAPGAAGPALPRPPSPDPVNHLEYAIEWFSFAVIPIVGWPIVLVRTARRWARVPAR